MESQQQSRPERWRGQPAASLPASSALLGPLAVPPPPESGLALQSVTFSTTDADAYRGCRYLYGSGNAPSRAFAPGNESSSRVADRAPRTTARSSRDVARYQDPGTGKEAQRSDWESEGAGCVLGPEEEQAQQRQQRAAYWQGHVAGEQQGEEAAEEEDEYPRTEEGLAQMAAGACGLPSCTATRRSSKGGGGGFFRRLVSAREYGLRVGLGRVAGCAAMGLSRHMGGGGRPVARPGNGGVLTWLDATPAIRHVLVCDDIPVPLSLPCSARAAVVHVTAACLTPTCPNATRTRTAPAQRPTAPACPLSSTSPTAAPARHPHSGTQRPSVRARSSATQPHPGLGRLGTPWCGSLWSPLP